MVKRMNNYLILLLIPCFIGSSIGQINLGLEDVSNLLVENISQITNISLVKDLVKSLSLEPLINLGQAQLNNLLKVANKNGLGEFSSYLSQNPTGTISDFASQLGFDNFASTVQNFVEENNKQYSSEEAPIRQMMLLSSMKMIRIFNSLEQPFEFGLTPMADWTEDEFQSILMKLPPTYTSNHSRIEHDEEPARRKRSTLPKTFDWRSKNMVTPVEDQGHCSSCYAFSSITPVESQWAIKTQGSLKSLSTEELVDCVSGNCKTSQWPFDVYRSMIENRRGYFSTKRSYQYNPSGSHECRDPREIGAVIQDIGELPFKASDEELMRAIYRYGPVSVTVNYDGFKLYKKGIVTKIVCQGESKINHAVSIVGWGSENQIDYWILKNSWNKKWGEDGYMRLQRGTNLCGINEHAVYPIV